MNHSIPLTKPSLTHQSYSPHGAALMDCFRGNTSAMLVCYQDGQRDDVPAAFWLREKIDPLESLALDLCRGTVLDVGAGAGPHALELQRRGFTLTAIDVSPECVSIMRERGVRDAQVASIESFKGGTYDTVLCLCNGLDKVERLSNLPNFLARMGQLLAPGGQLLADSFDLRVDASADRLAEFSHREAAGRYFGEMELCFEYKGARGEPFSVLQLDFATLNQVADENGWHCECVQAKGGHYLARLRLR
jgi:SAM-dependent methyltransferase